MDDKERKREQVRRDFPQMAAVIDDYRRVFGEVKVRWVYENGKEMGKPGPEGVIASVHPKLPEKKKDASIHVWRKRGRT